VITMDVILSILRAYVYVRAKNVPKKRKNNKKKEEGRYPRAENIEPVNLCYILGV